MQEEFEKHVQQKMEQLRLQPTAPVWEKIELAIRPRKRRRRLLWMPLLLLLLAGGYLVYRLQGSGNTALPPPRTVGASGLGLPAAEESHTKPKKEFSLPAASTRGLRLNNRKQNSSVLISGGPLLSKRRLRRSVAAAQGKPVARKQPLITGNVPLPGGISSPALPAAANAADSLPAALPDSLHLPATISKPAPADRRHSVATPGMPAARGWQKMLVLQAGTSFYTPAAIGGGSSSADYQSLPNGSVTGSGSRRPQPVKPGFAFSAGVGLTKKLGRNFQLSAGLQFDFYSTHQKVGAFHRTDSLIAFDQRFTTASGYYTNAAQTGYTTRFQVLSVPVAIKYQLFPAVPLQLSLGAAYGRLLHSNALTFSHTSNLYYRNRKNLNRNYLPVSAALQYRFVQEKRFSLEAGPVVQYNLLKTQRQTPGAAPHLFFAGVKTSLNF